MTLFGSVRKTNGIYGDSDSARMKSVRKLYLTPFVTFSPEWGIPSSSKMRMRPGMRSKSIKRVPREYREYGDKRPIHVHLGLGEAGHDI